MKKKLLWIGLSIVVSILILIGFTYRYIEKEDWTYYLSPQECYDENGNKLEISGEIINCFNKNGEKEGMWITYKETKLGKFKIEENYKNGKRDGKSISYYEDGTIRILENYKDGELDGKSISYDENGEKVREYTYVNGKQEGEQLDYYNGDLWLKTIYKDGKIVDMQENSEVGEKVDEYLENYYLMLEGLWNKFESGLVLDVEDFKKLTDSIYSNYNIYYDEEGKYLFEDMYREEYEDKSRNLIALYSMMTCSEDPSNPDTYLFNLDNPKLAQETYFKNCPKGCRYADEEDVDFICE